MQRNEKKKKSGSKENSRSNTPTVDDNKVQSSSGVSDRKISGLLVLIWLYTMFLYWFTFSEKKIWGHRQPSSKEISLSFSSAYSKYIFQWNISSNICSSFWRSVFKDIIRIIVLCCFTCMYFFNDIQFSCLHSVSEINSFNWTLLFTCSRLIYLCHTWDKKCTCILDKR